MEQVHLLRPPEPPGHARAHVGVVGSGDLEILIDPVPTATSRSGVRTSVDGFGAIWQAVLDRFFARAALAVDRDQRLRGDPRHGRAAPGPG